MKITVYTDGFFLQSKDVVLSTKGQSANVDFGDIVGYAEVSLSNRVDYNYHRPPGSLDELLSEIGSELTYRVTFTVSPFFRGDRFILKYLEVQTTKTFDPEHEESHDYPYSVNLGGLPWQNDLQCEGSVVRKYTYIGESEVKYEQTFERKNGEIIIYLVSAEYTLRYDANGGQGAPRDQKFYPFSSFDLSNTFPTRRFYEFVGWDESASAHVGTYQPGQRINSMPARDMTLYAVWRATFTFLPMRPAAGGNVLLRSPRNGLIIRHGDP